MMVEVEVENKLKELLTEHPTLFLVGVKLKGGVGNQRLIVLLDGDNGVTIDHCAKISRGLSQWLEEHEELISGKYQLEVSSAGLDHPIRLTRQYKKNIGRMLKVNLTDGQQINGKLVDVNEDNIRLLEVIKKTEKEHVINLEEIESSMVTVSFK